MSKQRLLATSFILLLLLVGSFLLMKQEETTYFEYTDEDVKMLGDFMEVELIGIKKDYPNSEDIKHIYMLFGSVVLHRLESRYWGETLKQVIYSPSQWSSSTYSDHVEYIDTPAEVYEWAEELLQYGPWGPDGLIYVTPIKFRNDEPYLETCGTYFYIEEHITKKVEGGKVN